MLQLSHSFVVPGPTGQFQDSVASHLLFQPIVAFFLSSVTWPAPPQSSSGSTVTFLGKLSPLFALYVPILWFPSKPPNLPVSAVSVACFTPILQRFVPMSFLVRGCTPSGLGLCLTTVLSLSWEHRIPEAKQLVQENITDVEAAALDTDLYLCDSKACSSRPQSWCPRWPLSACVPVGETGVSAVLGSSIPHGAGILFSSFLLLPLGGVIFPGLFLPRLIFSNQGILSSQNTGTRQWALDW